MFGKSHLPPEGGHSIANHLRFRFQPPSAIKCVGRSEEHTSELQSQSNLVCRLLLEKKKKKNKRIDQGKPNKCRASEIHIHPHYVAALLFTVLYQISYNKSIRYKNMSTTVYKS